MGLDGVELVMECEQAFGIEIPDEDACKVRTPGQLTKLVIKLMRQDGRLISTSICPSANHFFELRRKLMADGFERDRIRPSSQLADILPTPVDVRRSDFTLRTHLGALTERTRADQLFRFLVPALALLTLVPLVYYSATQHTLSVLAVICVLSLFTVAFISAIYGGRRSALSDPDRTLAQCIRNAAVQSIPFSDNPQEQMVWMRVRTIVAEQLGHTVNEVTHDADFVKDLGMG